MKNFVLRLISNSSCCIFFVKLIFGDYFMDNGSLTVSGNSIDVWKYPLAESHLYLWKGSETLVTLLNDFRKCPAADDLLSRIASAKTLMLARTLEPNTISYTRFTDAGPLIVLAPEATDPLLTLAFELFNAKEELNETLAQNGEQNSDEFAKQISTKEYFSLNGKIDIAKRCRRKWGKGADYLKQFDKAPSTLEEFLFFAEWRCEMDAYRGQWQEKYKPAFCKVHPEDPECIGPPRKFCDRRLFLNPSEDTKQWIGQRYCALFFQTSEELQRTLRQKTFLPNCILAPKKIKTDL
jgi:hypothetical protein